MYNFIWSSNSYLDLMCSWVTFRAQRGEEEWQASLLENIYYILVAIHVAINNSNSSNVGNWSFKPRLKS